ncbi:TAP binding protein (tapasin), tandem duplicate 1 [Engraulis encrasicolus]|uniref:TAP binding protein (tapasin), tandem duplicate 1 n=1 Tax=Engraulis encrasicolus TaxID=184585 RepID=UPI002FD77E37
MTEYSTIYRIVGVVLTAAAIQASSNDCPVLECWFVQEKPGRGGFSPAVTQEKSLMYISTEPTDSASTQFRPPADIDLSRVYYVTDPSASFCHAPLHPPEGAVTKPQCEINPFLPQPSMVRWAASLTESGQSPVHLQADWLSVAAQGLDGQLVLSSLMRAPSGSKEPQVVLSVTSKTASVRARLGERVTLDCGFWVDPSSPLSGAGFSVEWRYQFRGEGRLVLAYDGKRDWLAETSETGATVDFAALHESGDASLVLEEAETRHSGTYICTVYLPNLLAQVALDLEVVEPPSLSIYPSPLPLVVPGQAVTVQCEASGFVPLSLELAWEFVGADGKPRALGQGSVSGHRQALDGTYSQSSRLELDSAKLGLGRGGEVSCVAVHKGGTRKAKVALNVIGVSAPSIEDSMAMVAVALGLYGLIKVFSWTFSSPGTGQDDAKDKKEK